MQCCDNMIFDITNCSCSKTAETSNRTIITVLTSFNPTSAQVIRKITFEKNNTNSGIQIDNTKTLSKT